MKRLLVVALVLHAAPARAECVDLPGVGRQIDLPAGWIAGVEEQSQAGALFYDDDPADGLPAPAFTIYEPSAVACADLVLDASWTEEPPLPVWGTRYPRAWRPTNIQQFACLDGAQGSYFIGYSFLGLGGDEAAVAERLADALTTDVRCAWETPPTVETPAAAECVELPDGREMQVPAGWTVSLWEEEWGSGFQFESTELAKTVAFIDREGGSCTGRAPGRYQQEVADELVFGARYARRLVDSWTTFFEGCLETAQGPIWVMVETEKELRDHPSLYRITEAVADMLQSDIQCPWEATTSASATPLAGSPPQFPRLRTDVSAAVVRSTMPLGSYSLTELTIGLGGSLGPFWFGADGRLGRGYGDLYEGGLRLGAAFLERPRIIATFGISGRKVASSKALGLGFRIAATYPLPSRFELLAAVDLGWRSKTLEYTVPEPRTERGPFELEPSAMLGVGWRFVFAAFETRALPEFDQRTYGAVIGARYAH